VQDFKAGSDDFPVVYSRASKPFFKDNYTVMSRVCKRLLIRGLKGRFIAFLLKIYIYSPVMLRALPYSIWINNIFLPKEKKINAI
jgi:hypothetical protein